MIIKRNLVSADIEKKILTGLIISDNFIKQSYKLINRNYFKSSYSVAVVDWILDYYKHYKEAPKKHIQDIYNTEKEGLKESDSNIIGQFLTNLSNEYVNGENFNDDYLLDQTKVYFRNRSLTILADKIQGKLGTGKLEDAEALIRNYSKVAQQMSNWFDPFDKKNIQQVFADDSSDNLFKFSDELGEMTGWMKRDWLVAFMASMKKGKSWMLQELAIHALSSGLKVAYFSLEMNKKDVSKRIYKRISALAPEKGTYKYPVFDCERNQDNTCKKEGRISIVGIKAPGGTKPEFKEVEGYVPCTLCKPKVKNEKTDYAKAVWYQNHKQDIDFNAASVSKKMKNFAFQYSNNLRIMAYPAYSADFDDMEADLDELEFQEGFVPDVICVDYFDILNPGKGTNNLSERGKADDTWKRGKGLAGRRHCLVVTAVQSNRGSISKKSLEQEDVSEDIRKLAHVDLLIGLNRTKEEQDEGSARLNIVAHRHEEFTFNGEVMILQSLTLGQPYLFSTWTKTEPG